MRGLLQHNHSSHATSSPYQPAKQEVLWTKTLLPTLCEIRQSRVWEALVNCIGIHQLRVHVICCCLCLMPPCRRILTNRHILCRNHTRQESYCVLTCWLGWYADCTTARSICKYTEESYVHVVMHCLPDCAVASRLPATRTHMLDVAVGT